MKRDLQHGLLPRGVDVFLVEEQANPSTDYFVVPACAGQGRRVQRFQFDAAPPASLAGAVVVFVRYVPPAWRRQVQADRAQMAGVVYFMDDDVLDSQAWEGMPWRYRYKLHRLAARHRSWLRQHAELWVSTEWLERKYAGWEPKRVDPRPLAAASSSCRVFYHGSASHGAEIRWLQPVMEQVLTRSPRISFEIIGGQDVYRLYRNLPRVTVVHPMKWPAYEAFLDQPGRHIGLAPLLELPFNRARSCTKFFDITRAGAPGLYAAGGACGKLVRNGVDGMVLPMDPAAWVTAILALSADEDVRLAMAASARETILSTAAAAARP